MTFEPENSEVTENSIEIKEPLTETPITNLVYTATASSSSSSSISSSSSYSLSVKTSSKSSALSISSSSSSSITSSSSSSVLSSFFTHHSSSSSSSSAYTPTVCDGCNCPQEFILDPDDGQRQGNTQIYLTDENIFLATA